MKSIENIQNQIRCNGKKRKERQTGREREKDYIQIKHIYTLLFTILIHNLINTHYIYSYFIYIIYIKNSIMHPTTSYPPHH